MLSRSLRGHHRRPGDNSFLTFLSSVAKAGKQEPVLRSLMGGWDKRDVAKTHLIFASMPLPFQ